MNANPSTAAVANRRGTHLAAGSSWATSVTWVAILAPLPYSLSRLLWAAGVPFGISPEGLRELDSPGWGSLPILLLALLSEATAIFVHAFVLSRARTVPSWIPVLRGRPVRPRLVTAGLLMPIAILAYANAITAAMMLGLVNTAESQLYGDEWGVGMTGALFWMWGPALTAATLIYYRRTRRRAQPRSAADADSVAASGTRDRTGLVGSLPQRSLGLGCVRRVRLGGRLCSRRPWLSGRGRHGRPGWPL